MNKAGSGASHSPTFSAVVSSVARITLTGPIATVGIGWASRGALGGEGEGRSGEGRGEEWGGERGGEKEEIQWRESDPHFGVLAVWLVFLIVQYKS